MGEILASLFESVLFSIFLTLFLEPKRGRKELFLGVVLTSGLLFLNIFIFDKIGVYNVYSLLADLLILIVFWQVFLKGSLSNFLLGFALYISGLYFSSYLTVFVFSFSDSSMMLLFQERDIAYRAEILAPSKILLLLYIIIIIHFREKFRHHKQGISMLCYSILPIYILGFFIRSTDALTDLYKREPTHGKKMIGIMVGLHFIVIVAIYLSIHAARKAEEIYDVEKLNYMLELQRESLERFIRQEKELHKLKHELEHKLFSAQYLFEKEKKEEGFQIMKEMICELCGDARDISISQNIVDTIVMNIEKKYETEGIRIEKEILFPDETLMELVDLCILLGDLLDNAMEAAVRSTEKRVEISVREEYNCLYLKISNTFSAENSDVKSFKSKKGKGWHGFGIWNVREIVKRYGGELITYDEDQWFYVDVIIYGRK